MFEPLQGERKNIPILPILRVENPRRQDRYDVSTTGRECTCNITMATIPFGPRNSVERDGGEKGFFVCSVLDHRS
jgi:hypothetical protein